MSLRKSAGRCNRTKIQEKSKGRPAVQGRFLDRLSKIRAEAGSQPPRRSP
jgi:hypothetical protein